MERKNLPNAVAVLVLGICSIVFSCAFAGLICGIIGLILGAKSKKVYMGAPELYDGYGMLNAGYITSIIGTIVSSLWIMYYIVAIMILGSAAWLSGAFHNV